MKRLFCTLPLLATLWLVSCESPSDSSDSVMRPTPNPHGSTPANPALVFIGSGTYHGNTYRTISVMDSDCTHQTALYGSGSTPTYTYYGPTWSPNNGSIAFIETGNRIRAIDVTVSSTGTVSGTNARTIYTFPSTEVDNAQALSWSNTSTTDMIAFCTRELATTHRTCWVVSASGGTPVKVYETDSAFVKEDGSVAGHVMPLGWAVWSPDDSRLAVERLDSGTSTSYAASGTTKAVTIMIFTTTDHGITWAYTDSIKHSSTGAYAYYPQFEWKRSGTDKLALWNYEDGKLYYADPVSTTTLSTDNVPCGGLTWSPNNSSILHCSNSYVYKTTPFTTTNTTIAPNPSFAGAMWIKWKH